VQRNTIEALSGEVKKVLFDFLVPQRILFGPGCAGRLGEEAARFGRKLLLCTGKRSLYLSGGIDRVWSPLNAAKIDIVNFSGISSEPDLKVVEEVLATARDADVDLIVGAGGGSVLDVAKAAAGLYNEAGSVSEYFQGRPVEKEGLPWIAVPTTAGSGAEVTRNAVLSDPAAGKKQSIRCDSWMASVAVVDPVLTMSMPKRVTAMVGLDALTHALEAYTSRWATPMTDGLALEAVVLLCRNLYSAYRKGRDREARQQVMLGSLMAGIALNNARVGAVHALAHPVGLRYKIPHGLVCGILLPYVMEFNLDFVTEKYARVARELLVASPDSSDREAAERLLYFIKAMLQRLEIPSKLGGLGLKAEDIQELAEAALPSGSLAANPRKAVFSDLEKILQANL